MADKPILYTRLDCSYSDALRDQLDAEGADYREIDLVAHPEEVLNLLEITDGDRITPVLVDGDEVTIGFHGIG